ncbi:DUF2155 domain-containing protein [Luteithermobacter gelatinilyticus]|uniref:DUF2155 domain-containing protein n=1 Tax=Luteithermobacter gelatinilyticus TaxID=2582913 RepID=UPI001AEF9322|nr:DUF2155 domain-containing protein [Luteithermobacter gelatinilyticus]
MNERLVKKTGILSDLMILFVALMPLWPINALSQPVKESPSIFKETRTPVAVLGALDKITTRLSSIEARQNEVVRFGTLEIVMRYCRSTPPEETPESVAFLEITDVGNDAQRKKVFSGWMFASSPAVSPLEHPVYDIWLTSCKMVSGDTSKGSE